MRPRKFYTVNQWSCFKNNNYFDMQEMLCQRYDVILTDYKTKKQRITSILSHINLKNLDKGITQFNKLFASFGDSTEQLTQELHSSKKDKQNLDSIWGKSNNSVPIWSTSASSQARHEDNLEKIWGKGNWGVKFAKALTRILPDTIHGKIKFVGCAVDYVIIFLGMGIIFRSIGGYEVYPM